MDSRFVFEIMRGERGLGSLEERVASQNGAADPVKAALQAELEGLAKFFDDRADRTEKMYREISLEGERETRCLREVAKALRARASGVPS